MYAVGWFVKNQMGKRVNRWNYVAGFVPGGLVRVTHDPEKAMVFEDRKEAVGFRDMIRRDYPKVSVRTVTRKGFAAMICDPGDPSVGIWEAEFTIPEFSRGMSKEVREEVRKLIQEEFAPLIDNKDMGVRFTDEPPWFGP